MMNPEMMRMATEMMSRMTPEQMAQMQQQMASMPPEMMQQAMQMAQNATPEQMAQMRAAATAMPPEAIASQAGAAADQLKAQRKYQYDAAAQLKGEGNRLHGSKLWKEAAEKYERALGNLTGHTSQQSSELRTSCQSNLASCFLQLGQWGKCVEVCGTVLAADASNRKALYRRGQALCALGRYEAAVSDLRQAVKLSPESEKDIIREKLAEAKQKLQQESQGVQIEEVTEPAAAPAAAAPAPAAATAAAAPAQRQEQQEGLVQEPDSDEETDEDMPPLKAPAVVASSAVPASSWAPAPGAGFAMPPPGFVPSGMDAQRMQQAQQMFQSNPDMARQAAVAMSAMSDDQLASMLAQGGMPGITPDMAKQAAAMMRSMPPEQLAKMAEAQLGAAGAGAGAGAALGGATAAPGVPTPAAAAAATASLAGMSQEDQMRAASEALKRNPDAMKQAASMLDGMSEEQLRSMAAAMPGGAAAAQIDPAQLKMAAKMMSSMSPEDLERMQRMAASMQGSGGMGGMAGAGGSGMRAPAVAAPGGGAPVAADGGMPPFGGMPAGGFDPNNIPADMMADMRKRMQDPEMLKMMKGMLKGMDPQSLADMMKGSGVNVTPEQAASMVDKLDKVSDKHIELIARLLGFANAVWSAYQRAKAWAMSQGALAVAVLVLLVAVLLRWLGWI